jgi:hypothetical protein
VIKLDVKVRTLFRVHGAFSSLEEVISFLLYPQSSIGQIQVFSVQNFQPTDFPSMGFGLRASLCKDYVRNTLHCCNANNIEFLELINLRCGKLCYHSVVILNRL